MSEKPAPPWPRGQRGRDPGSGVGAPEAEARQAPTHEPMECPGCGRQSIHKPAAATR